MYVINKNISVSLNHICHGGLVIAVQFFKIFLEKIDQFLILTTLRLEDLCALRAPIDLTPFSRDIV